MTLHPAVSEISVRRDRVADAIAKGHLTPDVSRYMHPGWAHILKFDGSPSLAFPSIGNFNGADEENGAISYVVTTDEEDRDGDIVRPMGAQLKNYRDNPIVFFGHQEKPIPIGVCRSPDGNITVYPEDRRMIAAIYFDRADPDADFIYGKCQRKILNATSIAFVPIEAWRRDDVRKARTHSEQQGQPGWYFNQWDFTELSIVGVPSNPKAVGLEKDLQGACRDVFDREKSFMSMNLQKAWQPYVAEAKGCWGGWRPLPGDEKDIGGGVMLKAVKTCSCDDCTAGKACGCAKAVWPWSGKSEEIKRRRLEQLEKLAASGEGEPDDYRELADLKRELGTKKQLQKSRHPFEVRQSGEGWFVYDGAIKVSDALDSREEAEGYAAALWREQNKSKSKAMRRAEFERLWNGAPTEQQLDRAASELSRTSREDIEELAGIAGVRGGWEEVYDALERRSKMKSVKAKDVPCPRCKGEGTIKIAGQEQQCPRCNGAGVMFAAAKAATQADLDSPSLPGRKVNPEEKALGESDGRIGGYTVPPGDVQSDKKQKPLDDPQPEGWATCESCHGDGNCRECGGVGEGCDECGGSGECGDCAGEGHVEKSLVRKGPLFGLDVDQALQSLGVTNYTLSYPGRDVVSLKFDSPKDMHDAWEKLKPKFSLSGGSLSDMTIRIRKSLKRKQLDEEPPKPSTPQVLAALYSHAKAEGWATCGTCHGDGNCGACGGTGEGCDECGGSGECGACAGEGHVEKSLVRKMYAIRNRRNGKLWADEAGWQNSGGMVVWFNSVQEAQRIIEQEFRGSTPAPPPLEIVDENGKVAKNYKQKQLDSATEEPPKPSTPQVLAALYSHAKAEAAYIDQLDDQFKDTLADYRRQQLDERMASLKAMFRTTERDDADLEKLCKEFEDGVDNKGFESTGPDSVVEPGEAGMVEQGEVPPEEKSDSGVGTDKNGEPLREGDHVTVPGKYRGTSETFEARIVHTVGESSGKVRLDTGDTVNTRDIVLRKKAMKQTTEDDPEEKADAPFNKAAPGTEEWAEEEKMSPSKQEDLAQDILDWMRNTGASFDAALREVSTSRLSGDDKRRIQQLVEAAFRKGLKKAAPGTEEWAEEEMQEPEHKAEDGETVEEKAPGDICMCGAEIPEGAAECPGCGAPVEKADEPLDDVTAMDEDPVDDIPKDSDPSTEEILERYQHPKSHKWSTRKHRISKKLLPFLKFRKAANGRKYLVRGKQSEEPLDDSEIKSLTTKLASAIDDLKSLFKARETPKHFKPALKHIADQLWYVGKALTDKGKEQKQGGSGSELNDKGKEQKTGGKGSELKDKGEQQGKSHNGRKVSPVVERKLQETLAKLKRFGVLNGEVVGGR